MATSRIQLGAYVIIGIFLLLCLRLWQLQVLDGDSYKRLSEENRLRIVRTPAPRGIIYDRFGTPLVENIPTFSVSLSPDTLTGINTEALSSLLGIDKKNLEEIIDRTDNSPFVPIKLKQGISADQVARIEAHRSDFPGLFVETEVGRQYPFGKVGAHIIGYLGRITTAQLNNPGLKNFPPDMLIGQWGVEALFDDQLRGLPGERIIEIDALGRELRMIQQRQAVKGKDIELSIDIGIQKAVDDAFGSKAGAFVAVEPASGEILALESLPSFDPNIFTRGLTSLEWQTLVEDKKKPMLNRALQSQYPPGSTFKIITAIAALQEGVISPDTKIFCKGGITYGKWNFGCWRKGGHGLVDFHKAVVESCDVYFYELGKRLGIEKIYSYATALGLGKETGIKLVKEKKGLIPNALWKRENRGLPWYLGDTFISAIGQGFVSATPIQMAMMTATISNGGHIYTPSLIKNTRFPSGNIDFKPETIKLLKEALFGVVNEPDGTAKGAHSSLITVAGKTGTAQVAGKRKGVVTEKLMDHAWFVSFAPVYNPEIAVAVFVEHGGGGGAVAAPIAKKAIEAYVVDQKSHIAKREPKDKPRGLTSPRTAQ